jgi:hypothetical protein
LTKRRLLQTEFSTYSGTKIKSDQFLARVSIIDSAAENLARRWLRRSLFGYRRADVLLLLAHQLEHMEELAKSIAQHWEERTKLTRELDEVRTTLQSQVDAERTRRVDAELSARAQVARLLGDAEEEAQRIRHAAGLRVRAASSQLEELLGVREELLGELRGVLYAYGRVLDDAEHGRAGEVPALAAPAAAAVAPETPAAPAVRAAEAFETDLFPRLVQLDAGPFNDFSELVAFEQSLAGLPKVEDVHIRRFGTDRAEIELTLAEERPLVYDLDRYLPYDVDVRTTEAGGLTVDLSQVG